MADNKQSISTHWLVKAKGGVTQVIFQVGDTDYRGESATEIVRAIELDTPDYICQGQPLRHFLLWSLNQLGDKLPARELDLSDRLSDEALALSDLYLRDEYGAGELLNDH